MVPQKVKLRKIPIVNFINILKDIYQRGGDFFDIDAIIETEDFQDTVRITTVPEYFVKEAVKEEDDDDEEIDSEIPPGTDDDDLEALT